MTVSRTDQRGPRRTLRSATSNGPTWPGPRSRWCRSPAACA